MKSPFSYQARRELVEQIAPQYREAPRSKKMLLLVTFVSQTPSAPIRVFSVEHCTVGNVPIERSVPCPAAGLHTQYREQKKRKRTLGWRRTKTRPL